MNFSHGIIYFEDEPNKYYKVLFKISNKLYLNEHIDGDVLCNKR